MHWKLAIAPEQTGASVMGRDLALFDRMENNQGESCLFLYSWKPKCVSLGYSQKVENEIDAKKAKETGWDIVVRPTGGGIVFHNEFEVSYSIITSTSDPLLPQGLIPSYLKISEAVVKALKALGINAQVSKKKLRRGLNGRLCFSYPAEYEIVFEGKKIVGSAQKRGKKALLQQGSICVKNNSDSTAFLLRNPFVFPNSISVEETVGRAVGFEEICGALVKGLKKTLGISFLF